VLVVDDELAEISASLGVDAYVGKPFELTELLRMLEQQLGAIG
jgi:CheY-like chemotaxis protein